MNANQRLDRLAGFIVGLLTAFLVVSIFIWSPGCNSSPEANRIRTTNAVSAWARIAVAEGDLAVDEVPKIAGALRAAAKALDGHPLGLGDATEHAAALSVQFDLSPYASGLVLMAFTELEIYLSENGTGLDSERASQAAGFLTGIADGLDPQPAP